MKARRKKGYGPLKFINLYNLNGELLKRYELDEKGRHKDPLPMNPTSRSIPPPPRPTPPPLLPTPPPPAPIVPRQDVSSNGLILTTIDDFEPFPLLDRTEDELNWFLNAPDQPHMEDDGWNLPNGDRFHPDDEDEFMQRDFEFWFTEH
jgi:hypothetical protein